MPGEIARLEDARIGFRLDEGLALTGSVSNAHFSLINRMLQTLLSFLWNCFAWFLLC
jgi:hypothetical protein